MAIPDLNTRCWRCVEGGAEDGSGFHGLTGADWNT
jgi:hypothetical protein